MSNHTRFHPPLATPNSGRPSLTPNSGHPQLLTSALPCARNLDGLSSHASRAAPFAALLALRVVVARGARRKGRAKASSGLVNALEHDGLVDAIIVVARLVVAGEQRGFSA